jgi:regulator of RNase E activity RraA
LAGRAVTAKPAERDLTAVFRAIEACEPGDVVVVADPIGSPVAMWGENATRYAQRHGVVGAVLGTAVRDVAAHARLGFPLFALGATPLAARFEGRGEVNVPISIGGIAAQPGDAIVGDEDGVVVVPAAQLEGALARAASLIAADRATQAAIAAGARFPWHGGEG